MKKATLIFFSILSLYLKAQYNLVPNSSFETYSTCPSSSNQLSYANPWINPTTAGSPDFFNRCSPVFNNFINTHQTPKSGDGYSGIATYESTISNVREYIQVNLSSSLINNECYLVSFYVSAYEAHKYRTNNIGGLLSVGNVSLSGSSYLLSYSPQIFKFNNPLIFDTLNWVQISSIYLSNGGENVLTIGNFQNDILTNKVIQNPNAVGTGSYYFIDDIFITPIDSIIGGMPANAGADQSIVIGDSVFIGQEISNLNCNWYELPGNNLIASNTSGVYVTPNTTTSYVVEQSLCGNVTYDTVKVMVSPTGIKEDEGFKNSVSLFPNPSDGEVFITITDNTINNVLVSVTDITGKFLYHERMTITNNSLRVNFNVKAGIYFVTVVNTRTDEKIVKKLVIQ